MVVRAVIRVVDVGVTGKARDSFSDLVYEEGLVI